MKWSWRTPFRLEPVATSSWIFLPLMTYLFVFLFTLSAECDLVTFISIKNHFKTEYAITTNLFTLGSRTDTLRKMYENAAKTPVPAIQAMDEILGQRDQRSSDAFICTPIIGQIRRRMKNNIDIEIETGMVMFEPSLLHSLSSIFFSLINIY